LFEDAEEIEENIQACQRIQDQAYSKKFPAHEQQDCEYFSDLEQVDREYYSDSEHSSSLLSNFSMERDVPHVYNQFPNHYEYALEDGFLDNCMLSTDYT